MSGRTCDIAVVGGGLSGGLIALALARYRPELSVRLVEAGSAIGGKHRWSWFETDLTPEGTALMSGFRKTAWNDGYAVHFPRLKRDLVASYLSLTSEDFAAALTRELTDGTIMLNREVVRVEDGVVHLANGESVTARSVIDCRGFSPTQALRGGWQVFMGRHVRTPAPHGIVKPVIMDACVDQVAPAGNGGAYRFVYVLPLGAHDVFVEDTYYADRPDLDRSMLSGRIDQYCRERGLEGDPQGFETGVLPVITGGNFSAFQAEHRVPGVAIAGGRGGFVHPLTSYTLPVAVDVALAVAQDADLPGEQLAAKLEAQARHHWNTTGFYRALGRMLFTGAAPEERYRIFQRFYGLPEPLIERFYAGQSHLSDRARVLIGKPPIPIWRGAHALFSKSPPLLAPNSKELP